MGAAESLLVAGIVCIVAAVVGGGVKMLGAEMPVLSSFGRQALLFAVGLAFLFASFIVVAPKPAPPASASSAASPAQSAPASKPQSTAASPAPATSQLSQPSPPAPVATVSPAPVNPRGRRCAGSPLDCLPKSSAPVVFADPAAARAAAAQNLHDGLSTSEAEIIAASQGASSSIARACGIVASNDSSPLGKHDAAERVVALALVSPSEVSPACRRMSQAFL
ncbi:MAG: hypothetical protein JO111_08405 [Caulobacteraceae bacterium]|nr:hypothetical protein [Caulobacteraceae bacterium]